MMQHCETQRPAAPFHVKTAAVGTLGIPNVTSTKRLSPFLIFVKHRRPQIEAKHKHEGISMKEVLYYAGQEWHTLTED